MTPTNTAATKAGDFKCPKCGWLARIDGDCAVCTPPAESVSPIPQSKSQAKRFAALADEPASDPVAWQAYAHGRWTQICEDQASQCRDLGLDVRALYSRPQPGADTPSDIRGQLVGIVHLANKSFEDLCAKSGISGTSGDWVDEHFLPRLHAAGLHIVREQDADTTSEAETSYAQRIAHHLWAKHYREDAPHWKCLPNLMGVLTQIGNMASGLSRTDKQPARGEVSEAEVEAAALAIAKVRFGASVAWPENVVEAKVALEAAARVRESRLAGSNAGCADNCTECQKCEHCGGSGFIDVLDEDGEAFVDVCDGPAHDHESHVGFDAGLEVGGTAHRKVSQNDD